MAPKRRQINSVEEYANYVVEVVLAKDWVTRHSILETYMKNRMMKELLPQRLSPCQSKYGTLSGAQPLPVIALREYCPQPRLQRPPLKQRKIWDYFLDNDQPM